MIFLKKFSNFYLVLNGVLLVSVLEYASFILEIACNQKCWLDQAHAFPSLAALILIFNQPPSSARNYGK